MRHLVAIQVDPSGVSIAAPLLPCCVSCGDTEEEAKRNIIEAIECHLLGGGQPAPAHYDPQRDPFYVGWRWDVVETQDSCLAASQMC
jgi:predicted RNase H-like HicB family nuclease